MIADAIKYAQKCKACQIHADFIHQPPELLHPTVLYGRSKHGNQHHRTYQPIINKRSLVYPSNNRLFLEVDRGYSTY